MVAIIAHWQRFKVPITVSIGVATAISFIISLALSIKPNLSEYTSIMIFISGMIAFTYAMYWDASDRTRTSYHSDVAFWIHLVSAPLIVHPVFLSFKIQTGEASLYGLLTILALYLVMTIVSIIIDRRAFMLSALIYVIYALSQYFKTFDSIDYGFALTGTIIGSALLLLSAFWHATRVKMLNITPEFIKKYVPVAVNKV